MIIIKRFFICTECGQNTIVGMHTEGLWRRGSMSKQVIWELSVYMCLGDQKDVDSLGGLTEPRLKSPREGD